MPYVPATNRKTLIKRPSQELLDQTYGGGSFQSPPPIRSATVVPNATGLINRPDNGSGGAESSSTVPKSQVRNSPMSQRQQEDRGGQAGEPHERATGQIVDTEGQYDVGGTANAILTAMPHGGVMNAFGKAMQGLFGDYAVVGMENVGIGHPQWDQKMQMISNASDRNESESLRSGRADRDPDSYSSYRSTDPGRRGARESTRSLTEVAREVSRGGGGAESNSSNNNDGYSGGQSSSGNQPGGGWGQGAGAGGGGAESNSGGGASGDLGAGGRHGAL